MSLLTKNYIVTLLKMKVINHEDSKNKFSVNLLNFSPLTVIIGNRLYS